MSTVSSPHGDRLDAAANAAADPLLTGAIVGSVLVNVVSLVSFLLPGQDEVPSGAEVVAIVFAAAALVGVWGLVQRQRWAAWLTIGVTALNALCAPPAVLDPPSTSIAVVVAAVIAVGVVATLARPFVRGRLHWTDREGHHHVRRPASELGIDACARRCRCSTSLRRDAFHVVAAQQHVPSA